MRRIMLLAATACVAVLGLPVGASAGVWHVDKAPAAFIGEGGLMFITTKNLRVECTSKKTVGEYETTTTGWVEFTYHGCRVVGVPCTTSGQPPGTIKTAKLIFHNVMLAGNKPGILITPNPESGVFASSGCFGTVVGNGILAELSNGCGSKSSVTTINFGSSATGGPALTQVTGTGTVYSLESGFGNTWEDAIGAVQFAGGFEQTITCTV